MPVDSAQEVSCPISRTEVSAIRENKSELRVTIPTILSLFVKSNCAYYGEKLCLQHNSGHLSNKIIKANRAI